MVEDRHPERLARAPLATQETRRRPGAGAPQMQCGRRRKAFAGQSFRSESREFECEEQGNFAEEQGDCAGAGKYVQARFDDRAAFPQQVVE